MTETVHPPFTVTRAAVEAIEQLGGGVRLGLAEGGCCGTAYTYELLAPGEQPPGDDIPGGAGMGSPGGEDVTGEAWFGCPGAWLVVTEEAAAVLPGARLDYGARLRPPRFRVTHNPSTEHVCSCRRSFGRPWPGPGQPTCWSYRPMPWDEDFQPPARWQRQTGWTRHHEGDGDTP